MGMDRQRCKLYFKRGLVCPRIHGIPVRIDPVRGDAVIIINCAQAHYTVVTSGLQHPISCERTLVNSLLPFVICLLNISYTPNNCNFKARHTRCCQSSLKKFQNVPWAEHGSNSSFFGFNNHLRMDTFAVFPKEELQLVVKSIRANPARTRGKVTR